MAEPCAVAHLADARGIRVVEHADLPAEALGDAHFGEVAQPFLVDVDRGRRDPIDDDGRQADADRRVVVERALASDVIEQLAHDVDRCLGRGRLGRLEPVPLGEQRAADEIDQGALDAAAPEIDADGDAVRGRSSPPRSPVGGPPSGLGGRGARCGRGGRSGGAHPRVRRGSSRPRGR
jgi:hypothetical protein